MPYKDREKRLQYANKWNKAFYEQNKKQERKRILDRKKKIIQWLIDYRVKCACVVCGENTATCLDFHHLNVDDKDRSISSAASQWGWGIQRLTKEISKCLVLCSNCHRKLHAGLINLS